MTYNVIATNGTETEKFYNVTSAIVKNIKANFKGWRVVSTKVVAPKFWYYRGVQVIIHEDRQNGYTMVSSFDGTYNWSYANTAELEYR